MCKESSMHQLSMAKKYYRTFINVKNLDSHVRDGFTETTATK